MTQDSAGVRRRDVYRDITVTIVAAIERGAPTFQMPWHQAGSANARPANAYTDIAYRGVNVIALWAAANQRHFTSRYWATYKQWRLLGAQVRKDQRGSTIVFFKEAEREVYSEEVGDLVLETHLVARASFVFNADQVDGWQSPELPALSKVEVVESAEALIVKTKADIRHGGDRAYYQPSFDFIQMPERERFTGTATTTPTEAYYATLLHELIHWTGHKTRLDRGLGKRFGDRAYAMEELVAELGASFLCADLRICNTPRLDHAAYLASWLEVLKSDKRALFTAAGLAGAAAGYLTDPQPNEAGAV